MKLGGQRSRGSWVEERNPTSSD